MYINLLSHRYHRSSIYEHRIKAIFVHRFCRKSLCLFVNISLFAIVITMIILIIHNGELINY